MFKYALLSLAFAAAATPASALTAYNQLRRNLSDGTFTASAPTQ